MNYRKLGSTDLKVSAVGIGTHQFGGEWGKNFFQQDVNNILAKANELGVNLIDTAPSYGESRNSEKLIGIAIKHNRENWIIATKFGQVLNENGRITHHFSAKSVLKQLEESLIALKTDYIDIYQFHSGSNEDFDNDELWSALDRKVQDGKIRFLGLSIVNKYVVEDKLHQIKSAKKVKAHTIQVVYNRLNRKAEKAVFPLCQKDRLGVICRVPLAKGFLSGKYKPGKIFPDTDVRSKYDNDFNLKQLQIVEKIKQKEVPEGFIMAQWSLAWCLKHPVVSSVVVGMKNIEQVRLNATAAELEMFSENHSLQETTNSSNILL